MVRATVVLPTPPLSAPTTITVGFAIVISPRTPRRRKARSVRRSNVGGRLRQIRARPAILPANGFYTPWALFGKPQHLPRARGIGAPPNCRSVWLIVTPLRLTPAVRPHGPGKGPGSGPPGSGKRGGTGRAAPAVVDSAGPHGPPPGRRLIGIRPVVVGVGLIVVLAGAGSAIGPGS